MKEGNDGLEEALLREISEYDCLQATQDGEIEQWAHDKGRLRCTLASRINFQDNLLPSLYSGAASNDLESDLLLDFSVGLAKYTNYFIQTQESNSKTCLSIYSTVLLDLQLKNTFF